MEFTPASAPEALLEATGLDTRFVAIVWRQVDSDGGDGRPQLILGGCTEFEAAGLLRSAANRMDAACDELLDCPEVDDNEEEDDDDA